MLGTILIIILILALIGGLPSWGYSASWGYGPSGGAGILIIILLAIGGAAHAQNSGFAPNNERVPGALQYCVNSSGYSVPVSSGQCANGAQVNVSGNASTSGDTTITTGGTAQTIFGGTVPTNGWTVANPNLADDIWCRDSGTAAVNGAGSIRIVANGGLYETPPNYKPPGAVSCIGPTTGDLIAARRW